MRFVRGSRRSRKRESKVSGRTIAVSSKSRKSGLKKTIGNGMSSYHGTMRV